MKVMSRWPAMMGVVTVVPALNLSDPRDTNVVVAVGEPSKRYLSANQASTFVVAVKAAAVGGAEVKSPSRHTSCAKP